MYAQPIQKIVIDGTAVPVHLYAEAREQAIASRSTQFIGVLYDAPPAGEDPVSDTFSLLALFKPSRFFTDLREGNHLRYLMGCTYNELKTCQCAVILHITTNAEGIQ